MYYQHGASRFGAPTVNIDRFCISVLLRNLDRGTKSLMMGKGVGALQGAKSAVLTAIRYTVPNAYR